MSSKVQAVLVAMGTIDGQATGPLPFRAVAEQIQAADGVAEELSRLLAEREREFDAKVTADSTDTKARRSPYRGATHSETVGFGSNVSSSNSRQRGSRSCMRMRLRKAP